MPELPEVETIARQLDEVLPGRTIKTVEVLREKSFSGEAYQLIGKSVDRISRKAKNIVIELQVTGDMRQALIILIHLKMTGQLIFQDRGKRVFGGHPTPDWVNQLPSKHTRVIIGFTDGSRLYFNDMRVFGWVRIMKMIDFRSQILERLPPDVVDPEFTLEYLTKVLKSSSRAVKLVLLDQSKLGGLGNIYVNDALYLAHTKPTRISRSLGRKAIGEIHKACIKVIKRGIETGGASQSTYKHINGLGGKYQEEFLVYKREGERCGLDGCRGIIEKVKLGGRGTYFCPICQK